MTNITKRNLLKSFHILFSALWLGSVFAMMVLSAVESVDTDKTLTILFLIKLLDICVALSAFLTLASGLLISSLTGWGFRSAWIQVKIIANIGIILIGGLAIIQWEKLIDVLVIGETHLLNGSNYLQQVLHFNTAALVLLVAVFFISVFKPVKKKSGRTLQI